MYSHYTVSTELLEWVLNEQEVEPPPTKPKRKSPNKEKLRKEKSQREETKAHTFRAYNHTAASVRVYWINFEGNEVQYANLEPGMAFGQNSFTGHKWVARSGASYC